MISQFALWVFHRCVWWIIPRIYRSGGHSDSWNWLRLEELLDHFPLVVRGSTEQIFALYPIPLRSGGLAQWVPLSPETANIVRSFILPSRRHNQRIDSVQRPWGYLHFDSNSNGNSIHLTSQTAETDIGQRPGQVSNRSVIKAVGEFSPMYFIEWSRWEKLRFLSAHPAGKRTKRICPRKFPIWPFLCNAIDFSVNRFPLNYHFFW
jgi:hypothetical protein